MVWTEQEEDELRVLVVEYREKEIEEGTFFKIKSFLSSAQLLVNVIVIVPV